MLKKLKKKRCYASLLKVTPNKSEGQKPPNLNQICANTQHIMRRHSNGEGK